MDLQHADDMPSTSSLEDNTLSAKATKEITEDGEPQDDHMTALKFLSILSLAGAFTGSHIPSLLLGPSLNNGFTQLIIGSTILGIASAIQELTAVAAIAELVSARRRGLFLAINTSFVIVFAPAVLYTQLLSSGSEWRWLMWISLIWNGVFTVALAFTYLRLKLVRLSQPAIPLTWKRVDWVGIVLLTVSLTIFLVALQSGGQEHPWGSAYVLCQLILGIVGLIAFVFWEWKAPGCQPLVPFRLFHGQRVVALSIIIGMLGSVVYFSVLDLGPTIIQSVFELSHVTYGLIGLGPGLGLITGAIGGNVLLGIAGSRAREIFAISAVITTAFTGAQAVITPNSATLSAILTSLASVGIGALLIPIETLVTLACPEDLIGTAVALISTVRTMGGSIGYVILYNIFLSQSKSSVPSEMAPRLVEAGLPRANVTDFIKQYTAAVSGGNLQDVPQADTRILDAAREGFQWGTSDAARVVFYSSIPFGALAIVAALFLPNMKKYMTNKVLAKSHKSA